MGQTLPHRQPDTTSFVRANAAGQMQNPPSRDPGSAAGSSAPARTIFAYYILYTMYFVYCSSIKRNRLSCSRRTSFGGTVAAREFHRQLSCDCGGNDMAVCDPFPNFSGANGDREKIIFPVQLTTSRIGNLTRLILTLAICDDHT